MLMKRHELSSNRRSKNEVGPTAEDRQCLGPRVAACVWWKARERRRWPHPLKWIDRFILERTSSGTNSLLVTLIFAVLC